MALVLNVVIILIGIYALYIAYKLKIHHNPAVLAKSSIDKVLKKSVNDYCESMGLAYGVLGLSLIVSTILFMIPNNVCIVLAWIIMFVGIVGAAFYMYNTQKRYEKKNFK